MVPLDMKRLGAAYYTGNCHKWLCAPKGAGFLCVRRDRQEGIQPPILSHGWNRPRPGYSPFQDAFDWPGTLDPSAWLCVGEAIRFVSTLMPGGLPALIERNHDLAMLGRQILCRRLGLEPVGQEQMLGSMAAVILPGPMAARYLRDQSPDTLDNAALTTSSDRHRTSRCPSTAGRPCRKLSFASPPRPTTTQTQYERLAEALAKIQAEGRMVGRMPKDERRMTKR